MSPELGLYSPESIVWKVHSDPSMLVGGIRALLEQALHPVAMDGVAKNSNFREDAWGRLQRTGDYVSTLSFAPRKEAEILAARVRSVHTKLGLDDPHLLLWVHMALVDSFLDVAIRSGVQLSPQDQDQYVLEMITFAELVGINPTSVPKSVSELKSYFENIAPELEASDDAKRAALFLALPPMPTAFRFATPAAPAWATLSALATAALPQWARKLYAIPTLPGHDTVTNVSLVTTRSTLKLFPENIFQPPILKEARIRWGIAS
ncbi:MAG: oxygenase MpaB family protein [Candidatus Planktophila sp.]